SSTSAAGPWSRRSSSTRARGSWPRSRRRMAARAAALPTPRAGRSAAPALTVGLSTLYLSVVVLLPLAALAWRAHGWDAITSTQAIAALELTIAASLVGA